MWSTLKNDRWTTIIVGAVVLLIVPFFVTLRPELRTFHAALAVVVLGILGFLSSRESVRVHRKAQILEEEREQALRATEKRSTFLNSLIDNNPLAIVVLDPDARIRIANPAFEQLFQYTTEEALGQSLDDLILAGDIEPEGRELTSRSLAGESLRFATRRYRKDASAVEVEIYGVPLVIEDEIVGVFVLYENITERRQAEAARRESEERFRRLGAATFEGIVVVDDGQIVDANEQFHRMVQAPAGDIVGRQLLDFIDEEDRPLARERLSADNERPFEVRALKLDSRAFSIEVRGKAMPHEGRMVRVMAIRDVSEHRRLEDEARQAQKMEAVGRLAGGIAHDFNNLLTVILGRTAILGKRLRARASITHVEEIRSAAEQAAVMTQRLLTFARKQPPAAEIINLNDVLHDLEKMLRRLVRADIDLVFNLRDRLSNVRADPGQIEQVVLNLGINAADAMPDGGTLTLETSSMDLDDTGPHWSLDGSLGPQVVMEVTDTGIGMDAETRARVFEPFFTTKEKGKGTGLGLSTVYAIVQQNRGSILVESIPGRGTTFRLFLPQVLETVKPVEALPTAESGPIKGTETVLVVEDEPAVRRLAHDFLAIHGYNVLEAEDGKRGLDLVQSTEQPIDLVLTDVVMPGMNGPEMARRITEHQPAIKVLYMSGYDAGILDRDQTHGGTRMIQKPFSIDDLVGRVREALDETHV